MARTTYAEISHRMVDVDAKTDATFTMTDKLAKTSFAQIKNEVYTVDADCRETLEHNNWLADGVTLVAPDDPTTITWGLWSKSQSNSTGVFEIPPELKITFTNLHTSAGLTFTFCGDTFPSSMTITWYKGTTVLATKAFTPDRFTYYASQTVANYNGLKIEFKSTWIPGRRVKIAELDYGALVTWGKTALINASVLEEVDPVSNEVTIDTLDFEIHDENEDFNMLNPQGAYVALQEKQELTVRAYINGTMIPMGKYYLDTWENGAPTMASFTAHSIMSVFDKIDFKTGTLYNGVAASTIYAAIFAAAGWTNYSVENTIATELIYGYIPIMSVREALHQLSFALRAAVITARDGKVQIKRLPVGSAANPIEKNQKINKHTRVKQRALVNSVAVTAHTFTAGTSQQLYSQSLDVGTYEITFDNPATSLSIAGATFIASGVQYAKITVSTAGTVTISGAPLADSTKIYTFEAAGLTASTRSQASAKDNTLVSAANASALAQFLYEDYQRRIVQDFTLAVDNQQIGDNVDVDTMLGVRATGIITKLDIDLTGGFLADCEVRG